MRETPYVFISSTVEDLRAYREAAKEAAVQTRMLPRMLEYFTAAGDRPPLEACLAEVSDCDLLVVLVAHRYGWVPDETRTGQGKSITRLEIERALADGHEVLAFLVDEKHPWPDDQREEGTRGAVVPRVASAAGPSPVSATSDCGWLEEVVESGVFQSSYSFLDSGSLSSVLWGVQGACPPARDRNALLEPGPYASRSRLLVLKVQRCRSLTPRCSSRPKTCFTPDSGRPEPLDAIDAVEMWIRRVHKCVQAKSDGGQNQIRHRQIATSLGLFSSQFRSAAPVIPLRRHEMRQPEPGTSPIRLILTTEAAQHLGRNLSYQRHTVSGQQFVDRELLPGCRAREERDPDAGVDKHPVLH